MWLRIGKRGRWKERSAQSPDDVAEASKDLAPREHEDLSVYKVDSLDEATRVATAHALTQKPGPANIDAVVLPDQALTTAGLEPIPVPMEELPAYLSDRHYEIRGLEDPDVQRVVAEAALNLGNVDAQRLPKGTLKEMALNGVLEEEGVKAAISTKWKEYLDKNQ
ncbi:MAG: hypothetical protein MJE77_44845 [Proteobacteria bacterium]|nr:hypothetical protein [Pseudomonadota bacterium]